MDTINTTVKDGSNKIPKCLGYDRVSTLNQKNNGLSLETQKTKILEKVEELGGVLAEEIYEDPGITGTSIDKRPAIQAMMARCAKGDIDYIIVQDSSRISRNTLEYLVIKQTLKKYGTTIIPLTGAISADMGPMGEVMDEMIAVVHSIVPRLTSYKVKQTGAEKFRAGYYPSVAPLGYLNVINKNPTSSYDKRIIVPNPDIAPKPSKCTPLKNILFSQFESTCIKTEYVAKQDGLWLIHSCTTSLEVLFIGDG